MAEGDTNFQAFLRFPSGAQGSGKSHPKGESGLKKDAIHLGEEWSFSMENKLSIGPHTSGAGAGTVVYDEFKIKKKVDLSSPELHAACGTGCHFNEVELILFKGTGSEDVKEDNIFMKWTFNMLAVSKIEWSYGSPECEENVTFRFGVCKVSYRKQQKDGTLGAAQESIWNVVNSNNSMTVTT